MIDSVYDYRLKINSPVFSRALFFNHRFELHGRCRFALAGNLLSLARFARFARPLVSAFSLAFPKRHRRSLSLRESPKVSRSGRSDTKGLSLCKKRSHTKGLSLCDKRSDTKGLSRFANHQRSREAGEATPSVSPSVKRSGLHLR